MDVNNKQAWGQVMGKVKSMHTQILKTKDTQIFQEYLQFIASQYQYSFYNSMLIFSQVGNKQAMAGKKWLENGREVKDYKDKIFILCPKFAWLPKLDSNGQEQKDAEGKTVKHKIIVGFSQGYIYSIDNTSGKSLPVNPLNETWDIPEAEIGKK